MPVGTAYYTAGEAMSLIRSLLNDLDMPARSFIAPSGAVRASNVITITTNAAHGLVIGDAVTVLGITDTSMNGSYVVATVPTTTTFTYANAGANATSGSGYVDFLGEGDVYPDSVLLPFLNAAYRKVQRKLAESGSKSATTEVEFLNVPAGTFAINDATVPQLPPDFLAPRMMWERAQAVTGGYREMEPVNNLPDRVQGPRNGMYAWREEGIWMIGATEILDIKLRYYRGQFDLVDSDSTILIRGGTDAVAYFAAGLAANSRGAPQAAGFISLGEEEVAGLSNVQAHAAQYQTVRRRPYGSRF